MLATEQSGKRTKRLGQNRKHLQHSVGRPWWKRCLFIGRQRGLYGDCREHYRSFIVQNRSGEFLSWRRRKLPERHTHRIHLLLRPLHR